MEPDLSLIDELFAIIVGVTLSLAFSGWQKDYIEVVVAIVLSVAVIAIFSVVAVNQSSVKSRWIWYLLTCLSSLFAYLFIQEMSDYDFFIYQLAPIVYGVFVWIVSRECARFILSKQ